MLVLGWDPSYCLLLHRIASSCCKPRGDIPNIQANFEEPHQAPATTVPFTLDPMLAIPRRGNDRAMRLEARRKISWSTITLNFARPLQHPV